MFDSHRRMTCDGHGKWAWPRMIILLIYFEIREQNVHHMVGVAFVFRMENFVEWKNV